MKRKPVSKSAIDKQFILGGFGRVIFRGHTSQGWPLINLATDPPYFGQVVLQGDKGNALNAQVTAYEAAKE